MFPRGPYVKSQFQLSGYWKVVELLEVESSRKKQASDNRPWDLYSSPTYHLVSASCSTWIRGSVELLDPATMEPVPSLLKLYPLQLWALSCSVRNFVTTTRRQPVTLFSLWASVSLLMRKKTGWYQWPWLPRMSSEVWSTDESLYSQTLCDTNFRREGKKYINWYIFSFFVFRFILLFFNPYLCL